jgi:hypothetical protein
LNGYKVASGGISQRAGAMVVHSHEAGEFESFRIENAAVSLRNGTNVLAVEGQNVDVVGSEFSLAGT